MTNPILSKCYQTFCKLLLSKYCSLRVKGLELLPKAPFILCSNHCSHLDTPVLMVATGFPFNDFAMLAAKDYFFDKKRRSFLSHLMNLIPMSRTFSRNSFDQNIKTCQILSQQNKIIILFPEGTRSKNGGLQPLKKGATNLAYHLKLPIVPAYIQGTFEAMPKGNNFIKPKKINVSFGDPIWVKNDSLFSFREATNILESKIKELKCLSQ